jgi:hypothetical protein
VLAHEPQPAMVWPVVLLVLVVPVPEVLVVPLVVPVAVDEAAVDDVAVELALEPADAVLPLLDELLLEPQPTMLRPLPTTRI